MILNGPNLNWLGKREPEIYGRDTLEDIIEYTKEQTRDLGVEIFAYQSNCEGEILDILYRAVEEGFEGVVINAGAYSHYSYALRDCIECISIPVIEVHMSNIYKRESFRHVDVLQDVCKATFFGKGLQSYLDAINYIVNNK